MNKLLKSIAVTTLALGMATMCTACGGGDVKVSLDSDGYLIVNGEKTDVKVGANGQDGQNGQNGKSAYEAYREYNPDYKKTEQEWLEDLAAGKLSNKEYSIISYGRSVNATAVKGSVSSANSALSITDAVLSLNQPITLPIGEKDSFDICFGATLMPGGNGGGQILTSVDNTADGRVYIGVNKGNNVIFMGVCIEGFYANYCWKVSNSYFSEYHDYKISYKDGNYLLYIDDEQARELATVNINQNNITNTTGKIASRELSSKIRAVTGQNYVNMTHIGANSHLCTNTFSYYTVKTSPLFDYTMAGAHPLRDKTIFYLGSSVTRGFSGDTDGTSFADITNHITGNTFVKEAINGTTLALKSAGDNSYVSRLDRLDFTKKPDALVVQLSTNDFSQGINLGSVTDVSKKNVNDFDKYSMTGAIEYIIAKVKSLSPDTKVILYTCPLGTNYASRYKYEMYVNNQLVTLQEKWQTELAVLDLFSSNFVNVSSYMQGDGLHPTKAGYAQVFVPEYINLLGEIL